MIYVGLELYVVCLCYIQVVCVHRYVSFKVYDMFHSIGDRVSMLGFELYVGVLVESGVIGDGSWAEGSGVWLMG